ncbi:MAG: alpha/beta hydrolase [Pseudonocardiales bacterium]|nr:alpha/beta hydrolase [Pseudonocardiales bacterium]
MADVTAGGVRFHVQRLAPHHRPGQPEHPVVLIHGLGMDNLSSFYYTLANPLAHAGAEVILYDLRGHGMSERPRTGYQVRDSVTDLALILDALSIDGPVHLVGNSYGGMVALGFAVAYPARVASMVPIEANFSIAGWAEWIETGRQKTSSEPAAQSLLAPLGRKVVRMAGAADELLDRTTFLADLRAMQPIPAAELRRLACPVRAVHGEHSDAVDYGRHLVELLPHCVLTVLPGCGHSVLMDATAALREIVLDWFASQTPAGFR